MSKGLNSIYYHRKADNRGLDFKSVDDDKIMVTYTFELENCSKDIQKFYIKLLVPEFYKKYITQDEFIFAGDEINKDSMIIMSGKEKRRFKLSFITDNKAKMSGFSGNSKEFEFILYNDNEKVEFINGIKSKS